MPTESVLNPCANCGHGRLAHWHYLGAGLRPAGHGECLQRDCPCEKFAEQKPEPQVFACRQSDVREDQA